MNQERLMKILLAPRISEKTTLLAETDGQYTFRVLPDASKTEIKKAVELLFDVKVEQVQTINVRGKAKMFRGTPGARRSWKKAYVKLSEGHEIDFVGGQ